MIFNLIAITVILILGLAPMLFSIWGIHYLATHPRLYRNRSRNIQRARSSGEVQDSQFSSLRRMSLNWFDPAGYIGDTSCRFNAHSPFVRCAVNPGGPCQGCPCYETSPHLS
jgi:Family of unknown function (DUF6464)